MSNKKHCSVMGCGRNFHFKLVPNPCSPKDMIWLCDRCLQAGQEAVREGESEITKDIYERYYIGYPKGKESNIQEKEKL